MAVYIGKRKRSSETSHRYYLQMHKMPTKAIGSPGQSLELRDMQKRLTETAELSTLNQVSWD